MTRIPKDKDIEKDFRRRLAQSSLYSLDQYVVAYLIDSRIQIQYRPEVSILSTIKSTNFIFEINGEEADIMNFNITKEKRRQGHGRQIYNIIEEYCKEKGVKRMTTYASGQGRDFWPAMGFKFIDDAKVEKSI